MRIVYANGGERGAMLGMETREDLSDGKPEGGKRAIPVYVWEKRDP